MKDGENNDNVFGDFIRIVVGVKIDGETWEEIFNDHD